MDKKSKKKYFYILSIEYYMIKDKIKMLKNISNMADGMIKIYRIKRYIFLVPSDR